MSNSADRACLCSKVRQQMGYYVAPLYRNLNIFHYSNIDQVTFGENVVIPEEASLAL